MPPPVEVRALVPQEVGAAGRLLSRAFASDPVLTRFLNGKLRRRLAYPAFFRGALSESMANDSAFVVEHDGALAGCASWLPPEPVAAPEARMLLVRALFPGRLRPIIEGFERLGQLHPAEPHWYLAFVGVEPKLQSSGVGAALLATVHQRADASHTLCYLETPFPATHSFYRRHGYELAGETAAFDGAPPVARFLRLPR